MANTTISNNNYLFCAIPTATLENINGIANAGFDTQGNWTERGREKEREREREREGQARRERKDGGEPSTPKKRESIQVADMILVEISSAGPCMGIVFFLCGRSKRQCNL